jgi:hypothetical protein
VVKICNCGQSAGKIIFTNMAFNEHLRKAEERIKKADKAGRVIRSLARIGDQEAGERLSDIHKTEYGTSEYDQAIESGAQKIIKFTTPEKPE